MGSKIDVSALGNPLSSSFLTALNDNLDDLADEFDNVLYRDGSQSWLGNMNANSKRLYNLPAPIYDHEPLRLADLPNVLKGDKGDPGAPGGDGAVLTRAALKLLTPTALDDMYLSEAGREGKFVFDDDDLSADVTADPLEGLFVPPDSDPTGASGAWVRQFDGYYNVKWWGAKGDSTYLGAGTDDAAAINAALAYLDRRVASDQRGGVLFFPRGHYRCASGLDIKAMAHITLLGQGGNSAGNTAPPPTQIVFTGTGDRFIDARSTFGFTLSRIGIRYTNVLFTGSLIDFSHNPAFALDTHYALIERCLIAGENVASAARLIDLHEAILCSIVDNRIAWGVVGIGGRKAPDIDYSNSHYIARNTFDNLTVSAMTNAGEGWSVITNWFEGTDGGSGGMPRAYWDDLPAGQITSGLSWIGNWHGDATNVADAWFCNGNTAIWGLVISGGLWGTFIPNQCVKLTAQCAGIVIEGTSMQYGPSLGNFDHDGIVIKGNSFFSGDVTGVSAGARNIDISANFVNGGAAKSWLRNNTLQEAMFTGPLTATSVAATTTLSVGTSVLTGTNTPAQLDLGGTYSLTAGANPKVAVLDDGTNVYGIGVSASKMDYMVPVGSGHHFYVAGTDIASIKSDGIYFGLNKVVGARGAAIADAIDAASAITQLNLALAALRAHGLIAT